MKKKSQPKQKYGSELLTRAERAAKAGATDAEIIEVIGVSKSTFYKYMKVHPEFSEAISKARLPDDSLTAIEKLEKRKKWINEWIDHYLITRGEIVEEYTPDRKGGYKKIRTTAFPNERLLERILGVQEESDFNVVVTLAEPEDLED